MTISMDKKRARLVVANEFISIVASHGRRFFHHEGKVSRLELDARGRVWLVDKFTGRRVFTHRTACPGSWRGFTEGGTLRALVEALRDYVMGRSPLPLKHLGPWPEWVCDGDLWGYGSDMGVVRERCAALEKAE